MLCELDPCEPHAPLAGDYEYERSMRLGSLFLLRAMEKLRPRTMPQVISAPAKRRPRARNLWPVWYEPPRRKRFGTQIIQDIADEFGLSLDEIRGNGRNAYLVDARAAVAMVLRERGLSFPQVARMIGRRDHSTVMNLVDKFSIYCARNPMVRSSYELHRKEGSWL